METMEINGLQIASVAFSIFMMYFAYVGYRRKHFEKIGLVLWSSAFTLVIVAALFPRVFSPFAQILKIARVFDLFIVVGLFFLLIVTFINFLHIHKLNGKLSQFIQKEALKEGKKNQDQKDGGEIS